MTAARAITVRQPWPWAIAYGFKPIENRSILWKYRGLLLIHAGSAWWTGAETDPRITGAWWGSRQHTQECMLRAYADTWCTCGLDDQRKAGTGDVRLDTIANPDPDWARHRMPRSAVVAVTNLVDVHRAGPDCGDACDNDWAETEYVEHRGGGERRTVTDVTHLVLDGTRPCDTPVPWTRGGLGLWEPTEELLAEALAEADWPTAA